MKPLRIALLLFAVLAAGLWVGARHRAEPLSHLTLTDPAQAGAPGAIAFVSADFGGLDLDAMDSHAVPWKLVAAALVLQDSDDPAAVTRDRLNARLAGFGFLTDVRIGNLPEGVAERAMTLPLGMTHGVLTPVAAAPVHVSNLGCAACHAGVTYDAQGRPVPQIAWLGMPNTSLNLEAYTLAIHSSLKDAITDPDRLLSAVQRLFPDTGWREAQTLRWLVLPRVRSRLAALPADRPMPFPNGAPGSTNGVAALKHSLDLALIGGGAGDAGFVSIPDLGHRHWRSSLLADGAYAIPGRPRQVSFRNADIVPDHLEALARIASFFAVPSMGVDPAVAAQGLPEVLDIFSFLAQSYRPQPFPGPVDAGLARAGASVYAAQCSACHGTYDLTSGAPVLQRFPNWLGDVGTDPLRAAEFDMALVDRIAAGPYGDRIAAAQTGAYAAPPLTGIWASAPYLHNGSVPTVAALLTPAERPDRFLHGGHALDFVRLGILQVDGAYPAEYMPFSTPVLFDTRGAGNGNGGHLFGTDLPSGDKAALIAFLKRL